MRRASRVLISSSISETRSTQTPVPYASGAELLQSIATALGGAAGYPEILALTHGHAYFDNMTTNYAGALPPTTLAFVNAAVPRFAGTPAGQNSLEHNYTPTGDLRIPALTLSTYRADALTFHVTYGDSESPCPCCFRLVEPCPTEMPASAQAVLPSPHED